MSKTWLFLDVNYLMHRALYTTGGLSYGIIFGILRDVIELRRRFLPLAGFAFCFDYGPSHRKQILPTYKSSRQKQRTPEEQRARRSLQKQARQLRRGILQEIGFRNIFADYGSEADDLLARCCQVLPPRDRAIIVSADQDLYQLLDGQRITMWKPQTKKLYTANDLAREYSGIEPRQWSGVKAIAGCRGDDIPGVPGVGYITAAKYVKLTPYPFLYADDRFSGKVPAAWRNIAKHRKIWENNISLVALPHYKTPEVVLQADQDTPKRWLRVLRRFGIKSLG